MDIDKKTFDEKTIFQKITLLNKYMGVYVNNYLDRHLKNRLPYYDGRYLSFIKKSNKKGKKVTAKDIAEHFNLSKASVSHTVNSLLNKGYITLTVDENDHRFKSIELTKKAIKETNAIDNIFSSLEKEFSQLLSKEEEEYLNETLFKLLINMKEDN